jgi:hypothetical protein
VKYTTIPAINPIKKYSRFDLRFLASLSMKNASIGKIIILCEFPLKSTNDKTKPESTMKNCFLTIREISMSETPILTRIVLPMYCWIMRLLMLQLSNPMKIPNKLYKTR